MKFQQHGSLSLFIAPGGYAIRRDGHEEDSPAYWIAYRPGNNGKPCVNPQHELGAGAGDQGWLKCVRLCDAHADLVMTRMRDEGARLDRIITNAQPGVGVSSTGNSTAKSCESNSNDAQQGMLL